MTSGRLPRSNPRSVQMGASVRFGYLGNTIWALRFTDSRAHDPPLLDLVGSAFAFECGHPLTPPESMRASRASAFSSVARN